ncbi:MAG TPA: response regulator transcription factor [Blastocatellia bacterium]|nr:response regulator transcription factor [Blastocatellia bacterium]
MKPVLSPAVESIKVLLIGGQSVIRSGLQMLIASHTGLTVIGDTGDRGGLFGAAFERPDIIVLDLDDDGDRGLESLSDALRQADGTPVLILTSGRSLEMCMEAIRLGVRGLVLKSKPADHLIKAIEKVHAGEVWLDGLMMASLLGEMMHAKAPQKADPDAHKIASLTEREREVIALVAEGLKNRCVADRLFISETTVRHHLTSIFYKLAVSDRLELVIYCYKRGLVKLPQFEPEMERRP